MESDTDHLKVNLLQTAEHFAALHNPGHIEQMARHLHTNHERDHLQPFVKPDTNLVDNIHKNIPLDLMKLDHESGNMKLDPESGDIVEDNDNADDSSNDKIDVDQFNNEHHDDESLDMKPFPDNENEDEEINTKKNLLVDKIDATNDDMSKLDGHEGGQDQDAVGDLDQMNSDKKIEETNSSAHRDFLALSPAALRAARALQRSAIKATNSKKEVSTSELLYDLQYIREMYEDGIIMLKSLKSPVEVVDVIQQGVDYLLLGLKKHLAMQDKLLLCNDDSGAVFDPLKMLKQELTEYNDMDNQHNNTPFSKLYEGLGYSDFYSDMDYKTDLFQPSDIKLEGPDDYHHDSPNIEKQRKKKKVKIEAGLNEDRVVKKRRRKNELKDANGNYVCKECNETFPNYGKWHRHWLGHNKPEQLVTAEAAPAISGDAEAVGGLATVKPEVEDGKKRRRRICKSKDGEYRCEFCGEKFPNYGTWHRHLGKHNKPYKCDQCFKGFSVKGDLISHCMQVHNGERRFPCNLCPAKFFKKTDLERHIQMHNGIKPYKCEFCFHAFTTSGNLTKHVRRHTGEKPFSCDMCPKAFVSTGELAEHRRIHTGEKPYECHVCKKHFNRTGHLKRHIKTHTGVKPYQCEICQKCFTCRSNLKEHMNTHERNSTHERMSTHDGIKIE